MNTSIDAGSAKKLAGLQIDMLSKYRSGQLTLTQWQWFNGLKTDEREALMNLWGSFDGTLFTFLLAIFQHMPSLTVDEMQDWIADPIVLKTFLCGLRPTTGISVEAPKFAPLLDLGIITTPTDHVPSTYLTRFKASHQGSKKKLFYGYNDAITDANFENPSCILKPGMKLGVRAYHQIVQGYTTSKERMDYLREEKMDTYTGAQGAAMVFDQKRNLLPKGKWYTSFDEGARLPFFGGYHGVPGVGADSCGGFRFGLGDLEGIWRDDGAFFGFCVMPSDA